MKIDVRKIVVNYDGKPITGNADQVSWRAIISMALNSVGQNETLSAEDKNKCYQITHKIYASNEPDLTVDDRAFILSRIEKIYPSPLVNGRAKELFEEEKKVSK